MVDSWKDPATPPQLGPNPGLARPQEWAGSGRWQEALITGVFAALAILSLSVAVSVGRTDPLAVVVFGGLCVLFVLFTPWLFVVRNRPQAPDRAVTTHITGAGERGVRIRYATREYALMVTLVLVIAGGGSGLALGTAVSALLTDEGPPEQLITCAVVAAVCAAYSGWVLTGMARGRVVPGYVLLTPAGIYHRFYAFDEFVPWDALAAVAPVYRRDPRIWLLHRPGAHAAG